jgi:hypothetical protein
MGEYSQSAIGEKNMENARSLTPLVSAGKTAFLMNTKYSAALRASPSFLFPIDKFINSEFLDIFEIIDHAHRVFRPVAFIKVIQHGAGKVVAPEAILDPVSRNFLTVLNFARDTGF